MSQSYHHLPLKERLIVGLDLPDRQRAEKIVDALGDDISFYKIGYRLAFAGGLGLIADLRAMGKCVFLDMKLLDIDNTVAQAIESLLRRFITTKNLFYAKRTYLLQYTIRYFINSSRIILLTICRILSFICSLRRYMRDTFAKLFSYKRQSLCKLQ